MRGITFYTNKPTYDLTYRMLLGRGSFFNGVIDDKIQEEIVSTKRPADFSTTLKVDEELFVHIL